MEDFKEKYRKELLYQEVKANKYTLKGIAWFLITVAFIWLLTVTGIFEIDQGLCTIALVSTIILFIAPFCIYLKGDLSKPELKFFLLTLVCIASAIIKTLLSYHAVLIYVVPLLFAIQYRRRSTIWFSYAVNTITMLIASIAGFYCGICDLNILLKSQHVRKWYMDIVTGNSLNIALNDNPVFIIIIFDVFPKAINMLVFSIIIQYALISSNEDAFRISKLTYLKDTDIVTGVFNKTKYEEMVKEYYPKIQKIAVIFWDLNNLKYINDKYGHSLGDKAIERLSLALHDYSSDRCRVYRIGGDEFLMVVDYPKEAEVDSIVKDVSDRLQMFKMNDDIKLSSAFGVAYGQGIDILNVEKAADADMYENKKFSKSGRKLL